MYSEDISGGLPRKESLSITSTPMKRIIKKKKNDSSIKNFTFPERDVFDKHR